MKTEYNPFNILLHYERLDTMNDTANPTANHNRAPVIYTDERLVLALAIRPEQSNGYYADVLDTTPETIQLGKQAVKSLGYVTPVYNMPHPITYELSESGEMLVNNAREGATAESAESYAIVLMGIRYADKVQRSHTLHTPYAENQDLTTALNRANERIEELTRDLYEAQQRELNISIEREKAKNTNRTYEADISGLKQALAESRQALNTCINEKHELFARAERAEVELEDKQEALNRKQKELSKYMEKHPREEAQRSKDLSAILDTVKMMLSSVVESKVSHGEKNATIREIVRMIRIEQDNANAYRVPF